MASAVLHSLRKISSIYRLNAGLRINTAVTAIRPMVPIVFQPIRHSSFRSSEPLKDIDANHPQVEIVRNPEEWKFVEAILAKTIVPTPTEKTDYPSGWQPQVSNVSNLSYFVPRTKNHMHPIYLTRTFRGMRRITKLRRVQGDIWHLERELHSAIENRIGKPIVTRVNEMSGQIWFRGDFVNIVKDYLITKGL